MCMHLAFVDCNADLIGRILKSDQSGRSSLDFDLGQALSDVLMRNSGSAAVACAERS
jgi:hypothetical protein